MINDIVCLSVYGYTVLAFRGINCLLPSFSLSCLKFFSSHVDNTPIVTLGCYPFNTMTNVLQSHREAYPATADCYAPMGEDRGLCDQKLSDASLRLFQISGGGAVVLSQTSHGRDLGKY